MNDFLHLEEQPVDPNYPTGDTRNMAETRHFSKEETWNDTTSGHEIIFILEGCIEMSFDLYQKQSVGEGKMIFLTPGTSFKIRALNNMTLFIIRPQNIIRLCDRLSPDELTRFAPRYPATLPLLSIYPQIQSYLNLFMDVLKSGLTWNSYMDLKIQEFFFLVRAYYSREQLAFFFHSILNHNSSFASFVFRNYRNVRTAKEFAELHNSSFSNFERKFKQVFGMPPYQWMKQKRKEWLSNEIYTTNKPFSIIAEEVGFLSLSQMTDYCKKHLGNAPSKLRKMKSMNFSEGS